MTVVSKKILLSFSGIDGAGKSTQISLLIGALERAGRKPIYLWTRGGYTGPLNAAKSIARRLLGKRAIPAGRTEKRAQMLAKGSVRRLWLTLAIIDLALVYGIYIRWLKFTGHTVIADRYLSDTWIDFTLNFPGSLFDKWLLWKLLEKVSPSPDHSFLLLIPVEESLRRSKLKDEPFPDSEETLRQRLHLYDQISCDEHVHVIECTQSVEAVFQQISEHLEIRAH